MTSLTQETDEEDFDEEADGEVIEDTLLWKQMLFSNDITRYLSNSLISFFLICMLVIVPHLDLLRFWYFGPPILFPGLCFLFIFIRLLSLSSLWFVPSLCLCVFTCILKFKSRTFKILMFEQGQCRQHFFFFLAFIN